MLGSHEISDVADVSLNVGPLCLPVGEKTREKVDPNDPTARGDQVDLFVGEVSGVGTDGCGV